MTLSFAPARWQAVLRWTPALAWVLAGCAAPAADHSAALAQGAVQAPQVLGRRVAGATVLPEAVPARWWEFFKDPVLSELQQRAADGSLDLQLAASRIEESRAQLGLAEAAEQPSVGLTAGYSRDALSENSPLVHIGASSKPYNTWRGGLQASWELDLWGHLKQLSASAQARWQASQYEREALRVSVSADVARNYLLLRGAQEQANILAQQRQIAQQLLSLSLSRERNGVATRSDVAAARSALARLDAQQAQQDQRVELLVNALALLLGQGPRALDAALGPVTVAPPMPQRLPVGLPSELAHRRPDILQAEARLRAATADIGAAEADFYPRISLSGALGVQAFKLEDLGSWDSRQFAASPVLYLPLFDGGRLQRTLALTQARQREAGLNYRQTVLRAWHEVDDALSASNSEALRHQQLQLAQEQSEQALQVARRALEQGASDQHALLLAQSALLSSQSALTESRTAAGLALVALYRALGGGWPQSMDPSPAAVVGQSS